MASAIKGTPGSRVGRAPAALLPYQKAWATDESPVAVDVKSRRIGISWTTAAWASLRLSREGTGNVYYMSYAHDMTRQFIQDAAAWANHYQIAASSVEEVVLREPDRDILAFQIRFASGRIAMALSSSPRQLRSKGAPGDVAVLDEFGFCDEQEELLKAAVAFVMWGGLVRVVSTHNGEDNPFNQLVEEIRARKKPYSLHQTTLDDALAAGLFRRICLRTGKEWSPEAEAKWRQDLIDFYGDDADEELFCVPSRGSGVFFSRPMVRAVMREDIPVITWSRPTEWELLPDAERKAECEAWLEDNLAPLVAQLPANRPHWFGEDFARNQNLTVIWPGFEKPDTSLRVPFGLELFNIPFRQQEQVLFWLVDRLPRFAGGAMDGRGNGQALAEYAMQRYGADRIHRVMLSDRWYLQHFPPYKATVQDGAIEIPMSDQVLDDHRAVKRDKGVPKIVEKQKADGKNRAQRHGDSAIAGVMLHYAVEEIGYAGPPEYKTAVPRRFAVGEGTF